MKKPTSEIKATSTTWQEGRFDVPLYIRVTPEGTLQPINRKMKAAANYKIRLTLEYPTYQEELEIRKQSTRYDRTEHVHYTDVGQLTEMRVRRCLVSWDLHEKIPELFKTIKTEGTPGRLHRLQRQLDDESLELWQKLPPLIRKSIAEIINAYIGAE